MPTPPTAEEILEAARLAVQSYFLGEFKTKRSIRQDMTDLRSLLNQYDAALETQRLERKHD